MSTTTSTVESSSGLDRSDALGLLAAIVAVEVVGSLPAIFTASDVASWYPTLAAPPLTPPSWVFGPVWAALFAAIGAAAYLVYRQRDHPSRTLALGLFGGQLALNVTWSFAFFGQQSPVFGLVVILPLLAAIIATTVFFARIDRRAAALMVPYAAWVSFATYLNAGFWLLN